MNTVKKVTLEIEAFLYRFYEKIGEHAGGRKPEQVMSDVLFQFAEKCSSHAFHQNPFRKKGKKAAQKS